MGEGRILVRTCGSLTIPERQNPDRLLQIGRDKVPGPASIAAVARPGLGIDNPPRLLWVAAEPVNQNNAAKGGQIATLFLSGRQPANTGGSGSWNWTIEHTRDAGEILDGVPTVHSSRSRWCQACGVTTWHLCETRRAEKRKPSVLSSRPVYGVIEPLPLLAHEPSGPPPLSLIISGLPCGCICAAPSGVDCTLVTLPDSATLAFLCDSTLRALDERAGCY